MSATQPGQDFGANDWLVEEMYERYQSDPSSVTAEWIEFFKTYSPTQGTTSSAATAGVVNGAPKGGTPPVPKSAQSSSATPTTPAAQAPVATPVVQAPVATPVQALIRTTLICLVITAITFDENGRGIHERLSNTKLINA